MDTAYTLVQEQADRTNYVVLGKFLDKHPRCDTVRQEYLRCRDKIAWLREQRKKHVLGTDRCPERTRGTHMAIQDSIQPTYRCFYCCADMS